MFNKNNLLMVGLAGVSAAAVAILSVGGYLLHKKVLKHRLQEQVRQQAMSLAFFELANGNTPTPEEFYELEYGDNNYEDYTDYDDYDDEYLNSLLGEFNTEDNQ